MVQKRSFSFTDKALKRLPIPPKPKQLDYFDIGARGLGLRISYGGRKSFFAMYSNAAGKRQRVSLGEYGRLEAGKLPLAEARKRAKARLGEVAKDQDPAQEVRAQRTAPTVRTLATDFMAMQRKQGRKSADKQERMLTRDVLPTLGDRKARDLTRADIKKLMDKITRRGAPVLANRVHEVVRAMLNYGLEEEIYGLESNPADHLGKHRNPEQGRDRWLSPEEIKAYLNSLNEEQPGPAAALRLCLYTAQRQTNVLGMRLDQLSLDGRLWDIPAIDTKTNKPYTITLNDAAVDIIQTRLAELEEAEQRRARREQRSPEPVTWLFPKLRGGEGPAGLTFTSKPHKAVCARAKIKGYNPHDARHTFSTHAYKNASKAELDGEAIERCLAHAIPGTIKKRYDHHKRLPERRKIMEWWGNWIAATLAGNVVDLDRSRRELA